MLETLRTKIEERHASLVGLQVRQIDLPDSFEDRLVEIELKKQDAQKATEEILLAQVCRACSVLCPGAIATAK